MKINIALASAAALVCLTSCMQEVLPTESVISDQIGQSASALDGMVNSIYTNMVGYKNEDGGIETISYGGMRVQLEHSTTMMVCPGYNGFNTMGAWTQGAVSASGSNRGIYPTYLYYGYIKTVNDVIGMIDLGNATDEMLVDLGICYAYRALYYMDLVQIMEYKKPLDSRYVYVDPKSDLSNLGVPIVTDKTTTQEASNNPRATVDEVYDLILSDLAEAEKYLAGYTRKDKVEPDLAVVYGLFARAYTNLASRTERAAKYTAKADYWKLAGEYADKAISQSGCTPLTEAQWTDPKTGFNNRNSQNSWMLATHIDPNNTTAATDGSFVYAMIMGTETTFSVYGWRVGRALDRAAYERLSDNDWRKKSWLGPEFFYESKNQKPGEAYLVEKDANGNLINNKWATAGNNKSTDQADWSNDPGKYQFSNSASWVRSRINTSYGFKAWPWLYVNLKFRPNEGNYNTYEVGGATDFPIMRVEEMYFLKAEAELNTTGVAAAKATLEGLIKTRNNTYTCVATTKKDVYEELMFQKGIEFWGEGINYFDNKRLETGCHRWYPGASVERAAHAIDMNRIHPGWTPGFNNAELNGNRAVYDFNNPYTTYSTYTTALRTNDEVASHYGEAIEVEGHKFFDAEKFE